MMHLKDCHPAVCHTKLGPCVILPWHHKNTSWVMTADIVPAFKVQATTLDLFNKVMTTLVEKNPSGWREFTEKIFQRDLILPEAFRFQRNDVRYMTVGLKLINYTNKENFIIQPAQEMTVNNFHSNEILRKAYIHSKAINQVLGIGAKSYLMKKVLLLPQYKKRAEEGDKLTDAEERRKCWQALVFDMLHHPDLKRRFQDKINFEEWTKVDKDWRHKEYLACPEIPLKMDYLSIQSNDTDSDADTE